jgi:hypothetical protein
MKNLRGLRGGLQEEDEIETDIEPASANHVTEDDKTMLKRAEAFLDMAMDMPETAAHAMVKRLPCVFVRGFLLLSF